MLSKNIELIRRRIHSRSLLLAFTSAMAVSSLDAATLQWDANAETNVTSYRVYYGVATRAYTNATTVGNVTSWQIPSLTPGVTHFFAVTASTSDGLESDFSSEVSYTPTAPNTAPNVSSVTNQSITWNTSTAVLPFTVRDAESAASNLAVTATSSNPQLIPNSGLALGGTGTNRSIRATPATNQYGSSTVTLIVSDGTASNQTSFTVTVVRPNTAPTIAAIGDQSITWNTSTAVLPFAVGDAESAASALVVTASSSNPSLIPNSRLTLGGSGTNRSIRATPATNQFGSSTIRVTVSDGAASAQTSFTVTVIRPNTAPVITTIADQSITWNTSSAVLPFTASDAESAASSLTVTATSSNPSLIPNSGLTLGGSGTNRSIRATPATNQFGASTITVTVSDGTASAQKSFTVTVIRPNTAPTISAIADQSITCNGSTRVLFFNVGDSESAASSLAVTAASSNPLLIPNSSLVVSGNDTNRSIQATPVTNEFGSCVVTLTVSDGAASAQSSFYVTVARPNTAPTITAVSDQTITWNTSTAVLPFIVADGESAASNLVVTASSSNPLLFPDASLVLDGSDTNRSIQATPATDEYGSSTITLTVSDGTATTQTLFAITVVRPNTTPTISAIPNQSTPTGTAVGPLGFIVGDAQQDATNLVVSVVSSDSLLVPVGNVVLAGSGAARSIAITPASGRTGATTITMSVSDGDLSASASFSLQVTTAVQIVSFTNGVAASIPDSGKASIYPLSIDVNGVEGVIQTLSVTLFGLSHTWPDDIDAMLVGPDGKGVMLLSDAGGNATISNVTLSFTASATNKLPDRTELMSGTYKPTNIGASDSFPAPAPKPISGANVDLWNGMSPNGRWSLYVTDDGKGHRGTLQGWTLSVLPAQSTAPAATPVPETPDEPSRITLIRSAGNPCVTVHILGQPTQKYRIEASEDLQTWSGIGSVTVDESGEATIDDCGAANHPRCFYRAVEDVEPEAAPDGE